MTKNYVIDCVEKTSFRMYQDSLTEKEREDLADSILFDWNEIGDPKADFEDLVEWNVEQYFTHAQSSRSGKEGLVRIDITEAKNYIPYNSEWMNISYKPKPKYFMLRPQEDGFDKVYYYLDKKKKV